MMERREGRNGAGGDLNLKASVYLFYPFIGMFRNASPRVPLLIFLLSVPLLSAQISRQEIYPQAVAHARAQEFDRALELFRQLAEANSRDYESRAWIARLESWQEEYAASEQGYRSILTEQPGNLEAALGLTDVMGWQHRYQEALDLLAGLEAREPENLEVLTRLGKISRWAGHRKESLGYYRKALALDPNHAEALEAVHLITTETRYEVESGYSHENFDFAPSTHGHFTQFRYTDNNRLTLRAGFQVQQKFDEKNTRFTLGAVRRFLRRTYLSGQAAFAPTGRVVPIRITLSSLPKVSIPVSMRAWVTAL